MLQVVGKILEVEDLVQTDATRKRMKHLAHLPLSGGLYNTSSTSQVLNRSPYHHSPACTATLATQTCNK